MRRAHPAPVDTLLLDGAVVTLRPVRPDDERDLVDLYARTSDAALRSRFFTVSPYVIDAEIRRLVRPPDDQHVAVVAADRGHLLAVGCWERTSPGTAEFALLVQEGNHGHGVGTLMIEHLFAAAKAAGVSVITADVLADNTRMLRVLRDLGMTRQTEMDSGVVHVEIALQDSPAWQAAVGARESRSEHASLHRILSPRSIAVVGAGRRETPGRRLLRSLVNGRFDGRLHAVNRDGVEVEGVAAATSVAALAEQVDVAVIAVPAADVPAVVEDCAHAGVYGIVVVSEGFADVGPVGAARQAALAAQVRSCGMRLIGPNSLGFVCTAQGRRVHATLSDLLAPPGSIGVVSQSGGVGIALLDAVTRRGLGVSSFVSVGNKADVSGNDLLMYWEHDDATELCILYLESFGNPRKFARIARRVGRTKPIVAVTPRRAIGAPAASQVQGGGLTGVSPVAATPDVQLEALFAQAGVIHAATLSELLDIVMLLAHAPLPEGNRVAVVSNSAGPAALAADACAGAGLDVVTSETVPRTAADELAAAAARQAGADGVDAVLVLHASVDSSDAELAAERLAATADPAKPMPVVFLGRDSAPAPLLRDDGATRLPVFAYPETAAEALGAVARYARWRGRGEPDVAEVPDVDREAARAIVAQRLAEAPAGGWVDSDMSLELLTAYGIPVAAASRSATAEQAVSAARTVGFPVAVKAASGEIGSRTERDAVRLDVANPSQVRAAVTAIRRAVGDRRAPLVVQPMVASGVETAVSVVHDPAVGPMLMVALGGFATELLADRAFRLLPVTRAEARAQLESLRASPLLFGYRGAPPADVDALEDVLVRVSRLVEDFPEVAVLDLNPVIVGTGGAVVVDVKLRIEPVLAPDPYLRRLSIVPPG